MDYYSAQEEQHNLSTLIEDVVRQGSRNNNDDNRNVGNKLDYPRQIERWNKYQNILDKVEEKCKQTNGDVILRRNIKHNVKILDDVSIAFLSVIGLTALMVIIGGLMGSNYYLVIGGALSLAFVGWQIVLRLFPPSLVRFSCRPALHMEEYVYMNKHIQGIPKVARDPIVKLPSMEMQIPRSWLAQQGMLEFMESLEDIHYTQ
jgi:tetrahydromethanopterin S-methyltransferase subunit G